MPTVLIMPIVTTRLKLTSLIPAFNLGLARLAMLASLLFLTAATTTAATTTIATIAPAQEPLFTNRATDLRASPDDAAKLVRALPAKSSVQQLERRGAWTRVQVIEGADNVTDKAAAKAAPKETGWVRMMHLRGGVVVVESQPASSGSGFMSGFNRLLSGGSGRSSTQAQSATVGIRGLSPDELKTASPDAAALAKMNSFKSDKPEAERYAKEAKLAQANVPELNDAAGGRK